MGSELPVTTYMFPARSEAGPAPDIQIDDKKKLLGGDAKAPVNVFAGSGVRPHGPSPTNLTVPPSLNVCDAATVTGGTASLRS